MSVTGLMFAYSQAPKRYKTVLTALWLVSTAFGDLIVVFTAETRLVKNQVRFSIEKSVIIHFDSV